MSLPSEAAPPVLSSPHQAPPWPVLSVIDPASLHTVERLFAEIGVGLVQSDPSGTIVSVNPPMAAMLGVAPETVAGTPLATLMTPAAVVDTEAPGGRGLHRFVRPDAHDSWGRVSAARVTVGDEMRTLTVVEDVTALVEAEAVARRRERELRHVADTMAQMVWITNADGHHRYFNEQWYAYTGLPEGATDGWGWADVVHPDDYPRTIDRWRHSLETGEVYEVEYRLRRHDGAYRWQLGRANPHRRPDGTIEMWVGTCTDIHDAREAADEHRRLLAELAAERAALRTLTETLEAKVSERTRAFERSNAELESFAYVASHDLQEPLRKILSYADLVRRDAPEDALGPDALDSLQRLQGAAMRMSVLIRDLLALSRITSRRERFVPTSLGETVDGVVADLELIIADTGTTVDVGPLPTIEADATQMRQVFQNLIQNAIKYRRPDVPPVVTIRCARIDDGTVAITVADNGRGFRDADAERIFAPFQRLVGRSVEGSGIGLAIVRRIAERHGGTATASGTPGDGATFTLTLPCERPPKPDGTA